MDYEGIRRYKNRNADMLLKTRWPGEGRNAKKMGSSFEQVNYEIVYRLLTFHDAR